MLPAFSVFDRSSPSLATFFSLDNSTSLYVHARHAVSFRFPLRCLSCRSAKWNGRPINNANMTPWHRAALHPPKPNSPNGDLFRVYLNSIIHNAWAAWGGAAGLGTFFFSRAKSRIKQPRRGSLQALFFARGFLPPPLVTLAPAMFLCQPKMAGVVAVFCRARLRETRRESSPFFCRWRRRCGWFASVVRGRNARAPRGKSEKEIFAGDTQLREESGPSDKRAQKITMALFHAFHGFTILRRAKVYRLSLSWFIPAKSYVKLGFTRFCKIV